MSASRNKFIRTGIGLTIIVLLSTIVYWIVNSAFVIQTIEISGGGVSVLVDEKKIPKNLLFFPSDKIRSEILRQNVLLVDVKFVKKFPNTLVIRPIVRMPVAVMVSSERAGIIDREGYVLEYGDQGRALPVFRFDSIHLIKGEKIANPKVQLGLQSLENFSYIGSITSITDQDGPSILIKSDKTDIYIAQDKDIKATSATLQTLLAGFRIKGKLPAVVDLRFDKPVIQY